jgi:hypothetical protein
MVNGTQKSDDNRERCGKCHGFVPNGSDIREGHCQINPPTLIAIPTGINARGEVEMMIKAAWPPVASDRWCGAFAPAKPVILGR